MIWGGTDAKPLPARPFHSWIPAVACMKNITSSKSEFAKVARRAIFGSISAAVVLYAKHLPALLKHNAQQTRRAELGPMGLYDFICQSKLPGDDDDDTTTTTTTTTTNNDDDDHDDDDHDDDDEDENNNGDNAAGSGGEDGDHDFELEDLKQRFPTFWAKVCDNIP